MKKNHRFWSFTTNEQREILNMTTNEYGDFVFTLDGGEIWQFTPHQDKQIDVLEIDRIEGLGRGHDSKTGAPSPMSFLVLKNPKKTYTGNIRVLPRPPIETPPNSTDKPPAKAGETLLLDGELCKITRRDWEPEDSPEIVTRNGVELPPSTVRRYRCDFDLLSPSGEASRIVVTPPFMSTQVRMNPLKIESFKPRSLAGGLSGHDEIQVNAMVLFAEHSKPRQCFVERLPIAPATPPKPKAENAEAVELDRKYKEATIRLADNFGKAATTTPPKKAERANRREPYNSTYQKKFADMWNAETLSINKPPLVRNFLEKHKEALATWGVKTTAEVKRIKDAARKAGLINKRNRRKSSGKSRQV